MGILSGVHLIKINHTCCAHTVTSYRQLQLESHAAPELLVAVSIADRDANLHSPHSPFHEYDAHSTSVTHCVHAPQAKPLRTRMACVYDCCEIDACEFGVVPFVSYSRSRTRTAIRPSSYLP